VRTLASAVVAWAMFAGCAHGAFINGDVLIDPTTRNGSFEQDVFPSDVGQFTGVSLVSDWRLWTDLPRNVQDDATGVVESPFASHGERTLVLQPFAGAVYNLTDHVVQEGEIFCYLWDGVARFDMPWVMPTVSLVYEDESGGVVPIPGTETTRETLENPQLDLGLTWTAEAGSPVIGRRIGIGVDNTSSEKFPEFDNFRLSVIPSPGGAALLGGVGVLVMLRRGGGG